VAADEHSPHHLVWIIEIPAAFELGTRTFDEHITPG
jgi:hypothetical protein